MDVWRHGLATRRTVLASGVVVAGAALLAGCSADPASSDAAGSDAPGSATADPSRDPVLAAAIADEQALIAAYDAVLAGGAAPLLQAIRAEHQAHLDALGGAGTTPAAPLDVTAASLAERERAAAARCREHCAQATDPALVRTLAFIAASEASHVPALRGQA